MKEQTWEVAWWKDGRNCHRADSGFGDGRTHRGIFRDDGVFGLCFTCDEDQIADRMSRVEEALMAGAEATIRRLMEEEDDEASS